MRRENRSNRTGNQNGCGITFGEGEGRIRRPSNRVLHSDAAAFSPDAARGIVAAQTGRSVVDDTSRIASGGGADSAEVGVNRRGFDFLKEHGAPALIGVFAVIVVTAIMMAYSEYFVRDHLIFFYLLPIAGIAMIFSSTPAVVTSIIAVFGAAFFLFPPIFSFQVDERLQVVELFMFAVLAFIASKASSRLLR